MRISWRIDKGRGYNRPVLSYRLALEDFEKALRLPQVEVESAIPKPPQVYEPFCHPDTAEAAAGWTPSEFYVLKTPSCKKGELSGEIRLPWRPDNAYPEVEASFLALRQAFEAELNRAYDSLPMSEAGELAPSAETRRHVAPAAVAEKMLRLAGKK